MTMRYGVKAYDRIAKGRETKMKVLVIYSNDCKQKVELLRDEMANRCGSSTVLRMHATNRKKSLIPHAWHKDAIKMMKCADMIVYALSGQSSTNKNVEWELRKARKLNKYIVCLPMEPNLLPQNPCLYEIDPNTKERVCQAELLDSKETLFRIIEDYNSDSHIQLFHDNIDVQILLEQYKLFSETAENLVTRRQNVNSFYISANTALITIGGTIFAIGSDGDFLSKLAVIFALTIPGILLNTSWKRMLQSYYINNQGKMKILSMLEKKLAVSLYDAEWKAMKNKYSKQKYVSFTDNEKKLPLVFTFFYILVALICTAGFILYLIGMLKSGPVA